MSSQGVSLFKTCTEGLEAMQAENPASSLVSKSPKVIYLLCKGLAPVPMGVHENRTEATYI
jgi:hypothetical protein